MTDGEARAALAREIDATCRLTGTFVLRSGRTADEYFDKYRFEADPRLLDRVAAQLTPLVPTDTEVAGRRVLVVEDVVTSGGQVIVSTGQLRELGARVEHALCVIDRAEGGAQTLADHGVALRALFTRADLEAHRTR
ncbi:orotate phosphoribosyltransferase [Micromonospora chokoriensis]|nr:orotate phosphoribosyltransferase [Micromonospora chokoriensis]